VGPTAVSETLSLNSPRRPCKHPRAKKQNSTHGESIKSRDVFCLCGESNCGLLCVINANSLSKCNLWDV
jgi:hypothetical protein